MNSLLTQWKLNVKKYSIHTQFKLINSKFSEHEVHVYFDNVLEYCVTRKLVMHCGTIFLL